MSHRKVNSFSFRAPFRASRQGSAMYEVPLRFSLFDTLSRIHHNPVRKGQCHPRKMGTFNLAGPP